MLVKDLYITREIITIRADAPLYQAAKLLVDHKVSGLPVVDGDKKLLGVITERDLLELMVDRSPGDRVFDYMSRKVISFKEADDAVHLVEALIKHGIRRVPVVDNAGLLIGVVSRRDILKSFLESPVLFPVQ